MNDTVELGVTMGLVRDSKMGFGLDSQNSRRSALAHSYLSGVLNKIGAISFISVKSLIKYGPLVHLFQVLLIESSCFRCLLLLSMPYPRSTLERDILPFLPGPGMQLGE